MKNEEVEARQRMEEILDILASSGHEKLVDELRDKLQILKFIRYEETVLEKIKNTEGRIA